MIVAFHLSSLPFTVLLHSFSLLVKTILQVAQLLLLDHPLHFRVESLLLRFDASLLVSRCLLCEAFAINFLGAAASLRTYALAQLTLLVLKFDYASEEVEVASPGRNSLIIEVVLRQDYLLVEVPLVFTLHFFPTESKNFNGKPGLNFFTTYFSCFSIDLK